MDEDKNIRERKEHLLRCIRKITKAHKGTIQLLRDSPMSGLKLIERSSKCVKDPNPLASTMSVISTKFPITVDVEKARASSLPGYFIKPKDEKDMHNHGRVLCKKEAIEWWIERKSDIADKTKRTIDFMLLGGERNVRNYQNLNWRGASIKWGQPNIERRLCKTRDPILNIEPSQRNPALAQVLMPDFVLPSLTVKPEYIDEIKSYISTDQLQGICLSGQIRSVLTQMDPAYRYLPMLPQSKESDGPLKHALMHSNFSIIVNERIKSDSLKDYTPLFDNLARVCFYAFKEDDWKPSTLFEALGSISIRGVSIREYLDNETLRETMYIKWIKVGLRMTVKAENIDGKFITSPAPTTIKIFRSKNKSGVAFSVYKGNETVNFRFGHVRGSFTHDGQTLLKIISNYTDKKELVSLFMEIAYYIRWDVDETTGKNMNAIKREIRIKIKKNPHLFIRCESKQLLNIANKIFPYELGCLKLVEASEYISYEMENPYIETNGQIRCRGARKIKLPKPTNIQPLSDEFDVKSPSLRKYLSFKRMVKNTVYFYLHREKTLREKINSGVWDWENPDLSFYTLNHSKIATSCRYALERTKNSWIPSYASVLYVFANSPSTETMASDSEFNICGFSLDLSTKSGMLQYDQNTRNYILFNQVLSRDEPVEIGEVFQKFLQGYRLNIIFPNKKTPIRSSKYLTDNANKVSNGESFITWIKGIQFLATRDYNLEYQTSQTITRQISAQGNLLDSITYINDRVPSAFSERKRRNISQIDEEVSPKLAREEIEDTSILEDVLEMDVEDTFLEDVDEFLDNDL
uniref:Polymerase PB2 n=1 Tax=Hubei earwig virus 1 TaxID=1922890 RepID=A0A1L3KKE1_9VIRU|nr:polymerase PB2 [Hubei earwig virus 1]